MNTFKGFDKRQTKKLIMKTMDGVKQFWNYSEEDQKKIKELKLENSKWIQKIETFVNENKALKKLGKMPSEDEMAREVAKKKLMLAAKEKKTNKQRPKFLIRKELLQKERLQRRKQGWRSRRE